ncbi:structural maintenance of chromosomes protein 6B isoform X1 [Vigna radiata var. radiata]|uniref:Structural maintenance of chromosomes protein 6B isoform X1 n=2 Tax=Vigna radiata var. radiata TaxID=3916 RepID=A0A1S3TKJ6_VIGRR|nr:structural maintenance of chromosomes protein 6B isoform X1 [Vigna radiata var. radiata]
MKRGRGESMGESSSRVSPTLQHPTAGIIKRLRLENFMCHTKHETEFGNHVNFITGQNGSGKSAILTALCVAFGCRAKGTQRASTLKDFIKTGASNAVIQVEIQNEGEDAFKPEIYGRVINLERRISESASSTTLKDHLGRKVVSRKAELQEIVEHFNIDVENPCVIMTQDKSREFLHSGNNKDKFKFFYKATLLQQVNDLLESIFKEITIAYETVKELEAAIRPIENELNELQVKIRNMEHVEQISMQVQQLKKKLAWSWVYDVDKQLEEQNIKIEKLKNRIPTCQAKIDQQLHLVEKLKERCSKKRDEIARMLEKTSQVKQMKENLNHSVSMAKKEAFGLERDCKSKTSNIQKMVRQLKMLEQQVQDIHEQHAKNTQAEESNMEEKLKVLKDEVHAAELTLKRLKEEDASLMESMRRQNDEIQKIGDKIHDHEKNHHGTMSRIRDLQQHQSNKITVFGGAKVIYLLQIIERYHQRFKMPPIGPIGAHLKLLHGNKWALALEYAIGRLLNSFIVTNHADCRLLKQCAKEANYGHLQIIIYDFSIPRLKIPQHMLPDTEHPSILSVLHCDNHTVINVLVDQGNVERQVLVKDYEVGKVVAFERRIQNLKEVYTANGCRMFSRGPVQTVLQPNKRQRTGRLCGSFEDEIEKLHAEASDEQRIANDLKKNKREAEVKLEELDKYMRSIKRQCVNASKSFTSKKLALEEEMHLHTAENNATPLSSVDELVEEISEIQKKIEEEQVLLEGLQKKGLEAAGKADDLKVEFDKLCESANGEIAALEKAESELVEIEKEMGSANKAKDHYEGVMKNKVLIDIEEAEDHYQELTKKRKESVEKASIICSQNELDSLGGCDGNTPEQISAQLGRLNQTLMRESQRYSESIDDLRMLYKKKERKIAKRQQVYRTLQQKLDACRRALELRTRKFQRNATYLKHQLSWKFNDHLRKKGISGLIKVNYEQKTLMIEVQMPQDASNKAVRDTRGLSGGERSFSTLCFALALHEMTEAPFRAMDEFDVFMDAVSRKISLDTLVDFAEAHGSQWIFITPHDTSMVRAGDRIKKMQMAAPRS